MATDTPLLLFWEAWALPSLHTEMKPHLAFPGTITPCDDVFYNVKLENVQTTLHKLIHTLDTVFLEARFEIREAGFHRHVPILQEIRIFIQQATLDASVWALRIFQTLEGLPSLLFSVQDTFKVLLHTTQDLVALQLR